MPNGSSVISAHLAEHGLVYVPAACANRTGPAERTRREAGPGDSTTAARVAGAARDDGCDVHVHYHGCATPVHNAAGGLVGSYGWQFAAWSGYHEWAEANDIIVLHPQVTFRRDHAEITPRSRVCGVSRRAIVGEPQARASVDYGCWDWEGGTSATFDTREGRRRSLSHIA